jgi:hypothetical protein
VWALLVVVRAELVELALQLHERARRWSGAQPTLLGLMEALGLALGLRMAWRPVLLADTKQRQHVFERVAPAREPGGVDAAVIGERARRRPVSLDHVKELGHDRIPRDRLMGGGRQQVAGVVVQPVQDLDVGPVREAPVDEVRLPHLVRLGHLEAHIRAAGAFAWLGRDQPGPFEDPVDRRRRRRPQPLLLEVPADRHRTTVQPISDQPRSQLNHPAADQIRRPGRVRSRRP